MADIRVVFYEVFDDRKESEELVDFYYLSEPTFKKGDQLSLVEAEFADAVDMKRLGDRNREATHEIIQVSTPVIVYTGKTAEERTVISKIYIYYLKKIDRRPRVPLSSIASMLP